MENPGIHEALTALNDDNYCDVDPTFSVHVDDDFDPQNSGISRKSFCTKYLDWIQYCASRREKVTIIIETDINPIALRKAKIVYNFGLSECNRVKLIIHDNIAMG